MVQFFLAHPVDKDLVWIYRLQVEEVHNCIVNVSLRTDPPSPTGTWGNFWETRGGVGKKWRSREQKNGNFSETSRPKDRGKVTTDGLYTQERSFERYHSRPPTAAHHCVTFLPAR